MISDENIFLLAAHNRIIYPRPRRPPGRAAPKRRPTGGGRAEEAGWRHASRHARQCPDSEGNPSAFR